MLVSINSKQADRLSNFFFDVAKGMLLATIGLSVSGDGISVYLRFVNIFLGAIVIYFCIRFGLELIKYD